MRVIRTDMYFSQNQVEAIPSHFKPPMNPGLSFAYFGLRQLENIAGSNDLDEWVYDASIEGIFDANDSVGLPPTFENVESFFGLAVSEYRGSVRSKDFSRELRRASNVNRTIGSFAVEANVIIERSPPSITTIAKAIKASPNVVIGTFAGLQIAGDAYPLMLITIPAGIIVCGAAIGVSKGLENGLNIAIEKWIKQKFE